jgi:CubicO group peptidase (beta-lactamase class C family)
MLAALALCAATSSAPAAPAASLDAIVARAVAGGFVGDVLIVRGSRVLLDRADGAADRERQVPNTPATRFQIGSLTKQFTAAAILLLEQRGALATSDPITKWIPESAPRWNGVTLHALLTHTAGIPDSDFADIPAPEDSALTPGEIAVRIALRRPLDFAHGSRFAYSNLGFLVLGRVVELASGMRYEQFVTRNLLAPLGLADTAFEPGGAPRDAVGYTNRRGGIRLAPTMDLRRANACGGLWSTTADLVRWEQALFGGRVLGPAALAEMTTPAIGDYACGIHHRSSPGREVLYHTGRTRGFESVLGWYPQDSVAIAILTNLDGSRPNVLYDALAPAAHATP